MIDVSVIIPVYNAGPLIDRCLDSVFNQLGDFSIEVILVDDGSTDDSVEHINRRCEQSQIRLYQQSNSGPSKARNKGIVEAVGRYIAFIDADDYWLPQFLRNTVPFLETHKDCVAVSVAQRHITMDGDSESPKNWDSISGGNACVLEDFYDFWGKYNHICTGSILIRSEVAKHIGGMREDLRSCEDLEFWAMVASYGKMGYIPEILFVSDGNKVTTSLGWAKYKRRFAATTDFSVWFKRVGLKLTPAQKKAASPRFNDIIIGITRSFICASKFNEAYCNLSHYDRTSDCGHYILKIAAKGRLVWHLFCLFYLTYRYVKISMPYYKHKFGL